MQGNQSDVITAESWSIDEIDLEPFLAWLKTTWEQGEHMMLVGMTGSGKTTVAHKLLDIRDYVVVLGVKRIDETMERFIDGPKYGRSRYKMTHKWPADHQYKRVLLWIKPENLRGLANQSAVLGLALDRIYLAGGWCVFFDDAGYITGHLKLAGELGTMLNQGRSGGLTMVVAMTQPKSMVARIPSETFKQCRHQLIFKYTNEVEIKAIAEIIGVNWRDLQEYMHELGKYDFLYLGSDRLMLVRNTL